jgi:hypothetical protein
MIKKYSKSWVLVLSVALFSTSIQTARADGVTDFACGGYGAIAAGIGVIIQSKFPSLTHEKFERLSTAESLDHPGKAVKWSLLVDEGRKDYSVWYYSEANYYKAFGHKWGPIEKLPVSGVLTNLEKLKPFRVPALIGLGAVGVAAACEHIVSKEDQISNQPLKPIVPSNPSSSTRQSTPVLANSVK